MMTNDYKFNLRWMVLCIALSTVIDVRHEGNINLHITAIIRTHTHCINGHFPAEAGLAGCPLGNKGCWSELFYRQNALTLTQPTASRHYWGNNKHKFLRVKRCLASDLTKGAEAIKITAFKGGEWVVS